MNYNLVLPGGGGGPRAREHVVPRVTPRGGRWGSSLPLGSFDSPTPPQSPFVLKEPGDPPTLLLGEGGKREAAVRKEGAPLGVGNSWTRNSAMPRARGAAGADRPATPRPAHRHGRRAQREALVVVVPGPVQRVLELWPRTALGLADAFLTLVVHPARGGCHRLVPRPRLSSLPATNAASPARAAATPKRPSLRPGAFKVAFQKIHSPATSRASGWVKGGCPPRPATACGPPLAAATPGSALIRAGRAPCWEGHVGLAALRRRLAPPRPGGVRTTSGRTSPRCCALPVELQLTPTLCVCVVWSAAGVLCSFRGRNAKLRDRAVPFLRSGGSSLGEVAEGYVAPGRRPPTVRRARARILAAPRPPTPTDDPRDERGLQGHVAPAQRFRFSGEPGPGAEETVLEVRVPQVRERHPRRSARSRRVEAPRPKRASADLVEEVMGTGDPQLRDLPLLGWPQYKSFGRLTFGERARKECVLPGKWRS